VLGHQLAPDGVLNRPILLPFGKQDGLSLGFDSRGTVIEETYNAAGVLQAQQTSPFATDVCHAPGDGRAWLNVAGCGQPCLAPAGRTLPPTE
jgi:hypothetical protein